MIYFFPMCESFCHDIGRGYEPDERFQKLAVGELCSMFAQSLKKSFPTIFLSNSGPGGIRTRDLRCSQGRQSPLVRERRATGLRHRPKNFFNEEIKSYQPASYLSIAAIPPRALSCSPHSVSLDMTKTSADIDSARVAM